jgi:hypothetical protein
MARLCPPELVRIFQMKPKFSTLIFLTFLAVILLIPFVVSPLYLPTLQDRNFDLYLFFQSELYKQITGYTGLVFVILEMVLTARKRGRNWIVKVSIPGSMLLWRSLHIFVGVGLLGMVLIHTVGAQGLNFNAIFLWVFFAVTLSALVGVVAETGVLESPRKYFGWTSAHGDGKMGGRMAKGPLIRNLRAFWLSTHILLVSAFLVMLVCHIFLAYYYQ